MWGTSVHELILAFRDALVAIVPAVERVHMPWREPDNYDDWDSIAEAVYRSIVIASLENATEWNFFCPILDYDVRSSSYADRSFLTKSVSVDTAFICFETHSIPFDTCLFARLDESGKVFDFERQGIDSTNFLLAARLDGAISPVTSIQLRL